MDSEMRVLALGMIENIIQCHIPVMENLIGLKRDDVVPFLLKNFRHGMMKKHIRDILEGLKSGSKKGTTKPNVKLTSLEALYELILDELVQNVQKGGKKTGAETVRHLLMCNFNVTLTKEWISAISTPLAISTLLESGVLHQAVLDIKKGGRNLAACYTALRNKKACAIMFVWNEGAKDRYKDQLVELLRLRKEVAEKEIELESKGRLLADYLEEDVVYLPRGVA